MKVIIIFTWFELRCVKYHKNIIDVKLDKRFAAPPFLCDLVMIHENITYMSARIRLVSL